HVDKPELAGDDQLALDSVGNGLGVDVLGGLVLDGINEGDRATAGRHLHHRREHQHVINHLRRDHLQVSGTKIGGYGFACCGIAVINLGRTAGQRNSGGQHHHGNQTQHLGFLLVIVACYSRTQISYLTAVGFGAMACTFAWLLPAMTSWRQDWLSGASSKPLASNHLNLYWKSSSNFQP